MIEINNEQKKRNILIDFGKVVVKKEEKLLNNLFSKKK